MTDRARLWLAGGLALLAALSLAAAADSQVQTHAFLPEAASVDHRYEGGFPFIVGGGVAAFDCNSDTLPELVFAGGAAPAALYRNTSAPGGPLAFELTPTPEIALSDVVGAYPVEIDGDGQTDLVLLRVGENVLLRGLGDCRFARANEAWRFAGGGAWSTGFSATWEPGARWPTFAIANYIDRIAPDSSEGPCHDNVLLRPNATGDGFAEPLALRPGHCALRSCFPIGTRRAPPTCGSATTGNITATGEEQLWRLSPGTPPQRYGRDDGWQQLNIWGMGIASRDITGDGRPEYFLTSMADNKLRSLAADAGKAPSYTDIAFARGATAHRPTSGPDQSLPSTGWHAAFTDINNDGLDDLFIVKGNVSDMADFARHDPNVLLLGAADGRFTDVAAAAGIASPHSGRGGAVIDLNRDGRLDIVAVNREAPVEIWRNTGQAGNWLAVELRQEDGNRHAIGAWIEVATGQRRQVREVTIGGGHAGGILAPQHFGVADAEEARIRVRWPGVNAWSDWRTSTVNKTVTLTKPMN